SLNQLFFDSTAAGRDRLIGTYVHRQDRQRDSRTPGVQLALFRFELCAQQALVLCQPLFKCLFLTFVPDHVLTISLEKVSDGLNADLDRSGWLVFIDVLKAEVRRTRVLD